MLLPVGSCHLYLLVRQFRPGISEGNGTIEDQTSGTAFLIQRKIAQALELVTQFAPGISETRLTVDSLVTLIHKADSVATGVAACRLMSSLLTHSGPFA